MVNYTETIIRDTYREILHHYPNYCRCPICEEDVLCLALNDMPPLYTTTSVGKTCAKLMEMNLEFKAQAVQAVGKALEKVSRNPRH